MVYDSSRANPLSSVSVISTSGKGTITDINGHYEIEVGEKDSIWFSYLGKSTVKYPVLKMQDPWRFDIAIQINVPVLREIKILPRNYRQDSIQNRLDYAKAFNYRKVSVGSMTNIGQNGAGIDVDELIRLFQFRKNKMALSFQRRLIEQEKDAFINNRFSKGLVLKLTGLTDAARDTFMQLYRPDFEFASTSSDYEFQFYIKICFDQFIIDYPQYKPAAKKPDDHN